MQKYYDKWVQKQAKRIEKQRDKMLKAAETDEDIGYVCDKLDEILNVLIHKR